MAKKCKIPRKEARLFASLIIEDTLTHAEAHASEFLAFIDSSSKDKIKDAKAQNATLPCNSKRAQ